MPNVPTKDRPLNMPCDDPEGCKHFKAEMKLEERIAELEAQLEQHRWIPVSEEMPAQISGHWGSEIVFVISFPGKQVWVCKYNFSAEYWTAPSGDITHWKPIILP